MFRTQYSLRKCNAVLKHAYKLYRRKKKKLSAAKNTQLKQVMMDLQEAILNRQVETAAPLAKQLDSLVRSHLKRTTFDSIKDVSSALCFALLVAVVIRQVWFELYEIPTGSMRPTFKEKDRLVVTKTQFGINFPLRPSHFYFNPEQVKRSGIIVFTGENMQMHDAKTRYFFLFPGYKQYIKRMIGLPGDHLYFYGGKIYGVDKNGNDISHELQQEELANLEHIPFIHLDGKNLAPRSPVNHLYSPVMVYQMNTPIAKMFISSGDQIQTELLQNVGGKEQPDISDLWGIKNFATARILTTEQVFDEFDGLPTKTAGSHLYLELTHSPSLATAHIQKDLQGRKRPFLGIERSLIPLEDRHIKNLWDHMYTARFIVEDGHARRYGVPSGKNEGQLFFPKLSQKIPNGTYEFQDGKLYQVHWQGYTKQVSEDHPLATFDKEHFKTLFNVGMELDIRFLPQYNYNILKPARYAYFRDHSLYVMGAKIIDANDPVLTSFVSSEHQAASTLTDYTPFVDYGPPKDQNGNLDIKFIKDHGLVVPEGHYLVLGDNHAMSADSRDFGFVPQENLRGVPSVILWGPGNRYGAPNQLSYQIFTTSRSIVWVLASIGLIIWGVFHVKRNRLPLKFD